MTSEDATVPPTRSAPILRPPVLRVRSLVKSFTLHSIDGRNVRALAGVDLDVHAGEHVALAGSSGVSKSSRLKCIYRTYLPDRGEVLLYDRHGDAVDLAALGDRALAERRGHEIGYVSQFLRAEPRRSTLDVVARAGVRRGMPWALARDASASALNRLNIGADLWDVPATVLSGGEKQRVNLAAAIIEPPRLLLLDEPVSALDPDNRDAALDLIADLAAAGVAVLGVFHDLDAMARLASRVVLMEHGRVTADGPPARVLGELAAVAR
ncbi:ATP-binding cassette domain-containing protein [soil metagenome]